VRVAALLVLLFLSGCCINITTKDYVNVNVLVQVTLPNNQKEIEDGR
jgi:hypothetical protein